MRCAKEIRGKLYLVPRRDREQCARIHGASPLGMKHDLATPGILDLVPQQRAERVHLVVYHRRVLMNHLGSIIIVSTVREVSVSDAHSHRSKEEYKHYVT